MSTLIWTQSCSQTIFLLPHGLGTRLIQAVKNVILIRQLMVMQIHTCAVDHCDQWTKVAKLDVCTNFPPQMLTHTVAFQVLGGK